MKLNKYAYVKTDTGIEEIEFTKFLSAFAKEHKVKPDEAKETFSDVLKEVSVEKYGFEGEELKKWKAIYAAAAKDLATHAKLKQDLADQRLKAEQEEATRGELIVAAVEKGRNDSLSVPNQFVTNLQAKLGKRFTVSNTGLVLKEGEKLDEGEASHLVSYLANATEAETKMRTTLNLALGDAILIVEEMFGEEEADEVMTNAVDVRGQSKHTVQQTRGVVKRIKQLYKDHDSRPEGLYYTHWQEVKNMGWNNKGEQLIPTATLKAIIAKTVKGEEGRVLTCAEMRALLRAARPDLSSNGSGDGEGEGEGGEEGGESSTTKAAAPTKFGLLYLVNNEEAYRDLKFDKAAAKEIITHEGEEAPRERFYAILDLDNGVMLDQKGKVIGAIKPLAERPGTEPAPAPEPKKEKKSKKEAAPAAAPADLPV